MSDLAEKILKAVQAEEDTVPPLHIDGRYVGPRTDAERALLRRCAADREIVALHGYEDRMGYDCDDPKAEGGSYGKIAMACTECGAADSGVRWPCPTLIILARGYGIQPTPGGDHA